MVIIIMEYEDLNKKIEKTKIIKNISLVIMIIFLIWFGFVTYEYYRVKTDKRTLICLSQNKKSENDEEDSMICYGPSYKYKEYYTKNTNNLTAREFALFFMSMDRDLEG